MTTDWTTLMPHAPLDPGARAYVERADSASAEIARWILANRSPVLLGGPAGVGKSTELAHAARLLQPHRVACLIPIDRLHNMRRLGAETMLLLIAQRVADIATDTLRMTLSSDLQAKLHSEVPYPDMAHQVLTEVGRRSQQGRVTLLLDGLEKVPEGTTSLELFDALGALPDDVELVIVVPWHAAFGPHAETIVRAGERFVFARALEVEGEAGGPGRAFLQDVLLHRQPHVGPLDEERAHVVVGAARTSGGIPRMFLQLLADAASYAKLRRDAEWPATEDVVDAARDQVDTFRRLLLPGDAAAAHGAVGTDGRELDLARKIRLMAHGFLLERIRDHTPKLELHPLAQTAITQGVRRA